MIKLENTEVLGWEAAIRGCRNPMNSWSKSDTYFFRGTYVEDGKLKSDYTNSNGECANDENLVGPAIIGEADHKLMMNLAKAGSVDAKYRRMIVVTVDITAPLYWWKEFDTYKIGTVANSCSTMHKIQAKEFTRDDFSHEHLIEYGVPEEVPIIAIGEGISTIENELRRFWPSDILDLTIAMLNRSRQMFLEAKENAKKQKDESDRAKRVSQVPASSGRYFEMMAKKYWWQMIQLLPSSYNQRRTVMLNYEVLAGIYPKRKDHKLDEWHDFCDWIKSLPYSEIITLEEKDGANA